MGQDAELSCKELVEIVTDYLEGRLDAVEQARFERHLGDCDGCTIYLDQIRQTIRVTGMLTEEHLSREACDELLAAFRGWRG
jgi:predicted anti-sigma-YlaC factor YlaD